MNCFEWQNHVSDYLDGKLKPDCKEFADQHIKQCQSCAEKHHHYLKIIDSISNQKKSALPPPIRKSPFSVPLPHFSLASRKERWSKTPWYVRSGVEGLGITFTILFVIALIPKILPKVKNLYERGMNNKIEIFSSDDYKLDSETEIPLARGNLTMTNPNKGPAEEDFASENESLGESATEEGAQAHMQEIWRFNLKTDSPLETRVKIIELLKKAGLSSQTSGIGGTEAPGGIQFDLMVPQSVITSLKEDLQKIVIGDAFTWYKNKSKRLIAPGKARIVIWLSQI